MSELDCLFLDSKFQNGERTVFDGEKLPENGKSVAQTRIEAKLSTNSFVPHQHCNGSAPTTTTNKPTGAEIDEESSICLAPLPEEDHFGSSPRTENFKNGSKVLSEDVYLADDPCNAVKDCLNELLDLLEFETDLNNDSPTTSQDLVDEEVLFGAISESSGVAEIESPAKVLALESQVQNIVDSQEGTTADSPQGKSESPHLDQEPTEFPSDVNNSQPIAEATASACPLLQVDKENKAEGILQPEADFENIEAQERETVQEPEINPDDSDQIQVSSRSPSPQDAIEQVAEILEQNNNSDGESEQQETSGISLELEVSTKSDRVTEDLANSAVNNAIPPSSLEYQTTNENKMLNLLPTNHAEESSSLNQTFGEVQDTEQSMEVSADNWQDASNQQSPGAQSDSEMTEVPATTAVFAEENPSCSVNTSENVEINTLDDLFSSSIKDEQSCLVSGLKDDSNVQSVTLESETSAPKSTEEPEVSTSDKSVPMPDAVTTENDVPDLSETLEKMDETQTTTDYKIEEPQTCETSVSSADVQNVLTSTQNFSETANEDATVKVLEDSVDDEESAEAMIVKETLSSSTSKVENCEGTGPSCSTSRSSTTDELRAGSGVKRPRSSTEPQSEEDDLDTKRSKRESPTSETVSFKGFLNLAKERATCVAQCSCRCEKDIDYLKKQIEHWRSHALQLKQIITEISAGGAVKLKTPVSRRHVLVQTSLGPAQMPLHPLGKIPAAVRNQSTSPSVSTGNKSPRYTSTPRMQNRTTPQQQPRMQTPTVVRQPAQQQQQQQPHVITRPMPPGQLVMPREAMHSAPRGMSPATRIVQQNSPKYDAAAQSAINSVVNGVRRSAAAPRTAVSQPRFVTPQQRAMPAQPRAMAPQQRVMAPQMASIRGRPPLQPRVVAPAAQRAIAPVSRSAAALVDLTDDDDEPLRRPQAPTRPFPRPPTGKRCVYVKPTIKIDSVDNTKITLKWDVPGGDAAARDIVSYELFAYPESKGDPWQRVKTMDALPLPMACVVTLARTSTQLPDRYVFSVRPNLTANRLGVFSEPTSVVV